MRTKQEKAQYDMNYQKTHMARVTVWFNAEKDRDLLEWISLKEMPKSEVIRQALRNEMARTGGRK
jgi:hypothetical protein